MGWQKHATFDRNKMFQLNIYLHSLGNTKICNRIDIVCIFLSMYCINVWWRKELTVSPANSIIAPWTKAWTSGRSSGSPFSFVWTRGPAVTQDVNLNMEGNHLALDVKDLGLHRYDGASDRMGTFCETENRNENHQTQFWKCKHDKRFMF